MEKRGHATLANYKKNEALLAKFHFVFLTVRQYDMWILDMQRKHQHKTCWELGTSGTLLR